MSVTLKLPTSVTVTLVSVPLTLYTWLVQFVPALVRLMEPPLNWPVTVYAGEAWFSAMLSEPPVMVASSLSGLWTTSAYHVPVTPLPDAVPTKRPSVGVAYTSAPEALYV